MVLFVSESGGFPLILFTESLEDPVSSATSDFDLLEAAALFVLPDLDSRFLFDFVAVFSGDCNS